MLSIPIGRFVDSKDARVAGARESVKWIGYILRIQVVHLQQKISLRWIVKEGDVEREHNIERVRNRSHI